jgi:hypothetical protein
MKINFIYFLTHRLPTIKKIWVNGTGSGGGGGGRITGSSAAISLCAYFM